MRSKRRRQKQDCFFFQGKRKKGGGWTKKLLTAVIIWIRPPNQDRNAPKPVSAYTVRVATLKWPIQNNDARVRARQTKCGNAGTASSITRQPKRPSLRNLSSVPNHKGRPNRSASILPSTATDVSRLTSPFNGAFILFLQFWSK